MSHDFAESEVAKFFGYGPEPADDTAHESDATRRDPAQAAEPMLSDSDIRSHMAQQFFLN